MSLQENQTNSYLKFQIELLKNERSYYKKVKNSLKEKVSERYLHYCGINNNVVRIN